jgi:hypothetical protein
VVVVSTVVVASVVELTEGVTGYWLEIVTKSFAVVCPSLVPTVIGVSVSAGVDLAGTVAFSTALSPEQPPEHAMSDHKYKNTIIILLFCF